MSMTDDWLAQVHARLEAARQKCRYGRTYSQAHELADRIETIRVILSKKEEPEGDPALNVVEARYILHTAGYLFLGALTESDKLREVADALDQEPATDPRQVNLLEAYECAIREGYPPTLAKVKKTLFERFGAHCWSSDVAARKTLRVLNLPLARDRRGPKVGSRQLIRN